MDDELPIFIDFEASSLNQFTSYPIEVGLALANGRVESWLIRPTRNWVGGQHNKPWQGWGFNAQYSHNIYQKDLMNKGFPASIVASALNDRLAGKRIYSDCVKNDAMWCDRLFEETRLQCKFEICDASVLFDADEESLALDWLILHFEQQKSQHRAGQDAKDLQEAYRLFQGWKV